MEDVVYKIGMVDIDLLNNGTRHPNLAQMKMSKYCKSKGHNVSLIYDRKELSNLDDYDILILSKVFNYSALPVEFERIISGRPYIDFNRGVVETLNSHKPSEQTLILGGTGFFPDGGKNLDFEIEHIMPDYQLYDDYVKHKIDSGRVPAYYNDYLNFSIGFTTRGCFRRCEFCVNKKYRRCRFHAHVSEFVDESRPMIYLWDDNFLAYNGWNEILDELNATGKPFQFRQGLDLRLMTDKRAEALSKSNYYGDFIFAFDHIDDAPRIEKKLKMWRNHYLKGTKLYVLCAFDSWNDTFTLATQEEKDQKDIENTFKRIEILIKYGCLPYIMRYETYKKSKYSSLYTQLARWCNQPQFLKKMSFKEFCYANQNYYRGKGKCSAVKAYETFYEDRPDILDRYANIKWESSNEYLFNSVYGQPDTLNCHACMKRGITWDEYLNKSDEELLSKYYSNALSPSCLLGSKYKACSADKNVVESRLIQALKNVSSEKIVDMIVNGDIETFDNKFHHYTPYVSLIEAMKYIEKGNFDSFEALGGKITSHAVNKKKVGQDACAFLSQMDLAYNSHYSRNKSIELSKLGQIVMKSPDDIRDDLLRKVILKLPLVNKMIVFSQQNYTSIEQFLKNIGEPQNKNTISTLKWMVKLLREDPNLTPYLKKITTDE